MVGITFMVFITFMGDTATTRIVIVSVLLVSSINCHVYLFHAVILLVYYDCSILLDLYFMPYLSRTYS